MLGTATTDIFPSSFKENTGTCPHRRELKTKALVKLLYETLRFD